MHFVIVFLLGTLFLSNSYAFTLNNNVEAAFKQDEIKVNVASHNCENTGTTPEDILDMADVAIQEYWNRVSMSSLKLVKGSVVDVSDKFSVGQLCESQVRGESCSSNDVPQVESDILISCNSNTSVNFTNATLGVTLPNNIDGATIKGAIILINNTSSSSVNTLDRNGFIAVLAHEIGHAIGLGHSPVQEALMYYSTIPKRKMLGQDDYDGVIYLYPAELGPISCASITLTSGGLTKGGKKGPKPWTFLLAFALGFLFLCIFSLILRNVPREITTNRAKMA